jgi:hypothetical protein
MTIRNGGYRCDHCHDGKGPATRWPVTMETRGLGERCPGCFRWWHGNVYACHHVRVNSQIARWQDQSMGLEEVILDWLTNNPLSRP